MEVIINLAIFLGLLTIGYVVGVRIEKQHFRSLQERERQFLPMPAVGMKRVDSPSPVAKAELAIGSVVVSVDYYKRFLAGLRNLFGGEVRSYSPLMDRARREALLRMKEQAIGADMIINVRLETSSISGDSRAQQKLACVEVIAYGTAIWLERTPA
jgi:uncharacterized protein YbjQ (UPF0145 family)